MSQPSNQLQNIGECPSSLSIGGDPFQLRPLARQALSSFTRLRSSYSLPPLAKSVLSAPLQPQLRHIAQPHLQPIAQPQLPPLPKPPTQPIAQPRLPPLENVEDPSRLCHSSIDDRFEQKPLARQRLLPIPTVRQSRPRTRTQHQPRPKALAKPQPHPHLLPVPQSQGHPLHSPPPKPRLEDLDEPTSLCCGKPFRPPTPTPARSSSRAVTSGEPLLVKSKVRLNKAARPTATPYFFLGEEDEEPFSLTPFDINN